ncbi:MAG: hypothetical protein F6K16_03655 [Symploca sp. SIO2B6]|nr:hypothetical protein [Symploca sp. SIO2B6]
MCTFICDFFATPTAYSTNTRKDDSQPSSIENYLPKQLKEIANKVSLTIEILQDESKASIYWQDVIKLKDEIDLKLEGFITAIFDDRLNLITQTVEQAIFFYNNFLEKQKQYQQETPEQSQREKAWIEQQRRELEQLRSSIETIINPVAS